MQRLLSIIPLAGLLAACVDEIDLGQDSPLADGIVVSGRVLPNGEVFEARVLVERLFQFSSSNLPERVISATVTVENSRGQVVDLRYSFDDNIYQADIAADDPDFVFEVGEEYFVRVITQEGEEYRSDPEELMPPTVPDSFSIVYSEPLRPNLIGTPTPAPEVEYRLSVTARYPDGRPAFYRWRLSEIYQITDRSASRCYGRQRINNQTLAIYGNRNGIDYASNVTIGSNPVEWNYSEGHYLEVEQYSLTERAYTYFEQIEAVANQERSIFEAPPALIEGNVRPGNEAAGRVFGYFFVATPTIYRAPVLPEQVNDPEACNDFVTDPPPFLCITCLRIPNATFIRPDWWEL